MKYSLIEFVAIDIVFSIYMSGVLRVELFQERRFCKLPGCNFSPAEANRVCCSRSHNSEYEKLFEFIGKRQLRE